jgi:hypothetical protein
VATPLEVLPAPNDPPPVTVQVTPALAPSFATVAVNACAAPAAIATGATGPILTEMGVNGIVTEAALVESVLLVAVTVAEEVVTGMGAVYTPLLIDPTDAVQFTPAFAESPATVAAKVCVAPPTIFTATEGLTETLIAVSEVEDDDEVEPPPQPEIRPKARSPAETRPIRQRFNMK